LYKKPPEFFAKTPKDSTNPSRTRRAAGNVVGDGQMLCCGTLDRESRLKWCLHRRTGDEMDLQPLQIVAGIVQRVEAPAV
jgi:hypothetical protein